MNQRSAGFTLLEIIVALVVFGFLIAGLSQTVRFGLAAWRTEGHLSDSKTDLEAVDSTLRVVVRNLSPETDEGEPAIVGTNDTLVGISRMPIPTAGLQEAPVEVGLAVSGNRLILRWRPYMHAEPLRAAPAPQETTLVGDVERIRIAYWKPNGGWVNTWKQPDLPTLIRLRVSFLRDKPPQWPDLVMAPMLSRP